MYSIVKQLHFKLSESWYRKSQQNRFVSPKGVSSLWDTKDTAIIGYIPSLFGSRLNDKRNHISPWWYQYFWKKDEIKNSIPVTTSGLLQKLQWATMIIPHICADGCPYVSAWKIFCLVYIFSQSTACRALKYSAIKIDGDQ